MITHMPKNVIVLVIDT